MKQGSSNRKVNEQAREVIASILLFDIADRRLQLVTITGCEVSYDRSVCNVFYSTEPRRYDEVKEALEGCRGRIRSLMAKQLSWRVAPELRFHLDTSVDEAEVIAEALMRDRARNEESAALAEAAQVAQAAWEPHETEAASESAHAQAGVDADGDASERR